MLRLFVFLVLIIFASYSQIDGCTGIRLTAKDGASINGRTVEFGTELDMHVAFIPRNVAFTSTTPKGKGLKYSSKYAACGIYCFNEQVLMDGINEKGLAAAAFYFPGFASYTDTTDDNQGKALSPVEFTNWILTQFATLEEVQAALDSVVIAPTVGKGWGTEPPPFHYIVYDREGKSLVIEPLNNTLVAYENKIGCFTNSPTFDWHMTNLRNYINLTPFNHDPISMRGVDLAPFGQGSGMVGLPGDFTPPSRFVRAAIFSSTAIPSQNANEAVGQTFHILNQFDIPVGVARQKVENQIHTDYTMLTSVKDPISLRYYFKSYDDQTIQWVALDQFDLDGKSILSAETKTKPATFNISPSLQ